MTSSKPELRNKGLERRDGVDSGTRERLASRLAALGPGLVLDFMPSAGGRPIASLFSPIGSEPDTMPLGAALRERELRMALPVDWSHGAPLLYRRWMPGDRLAIGPLGIAEPLADSPAVDPDVLFVPVIAFDRRGHRLGYGAGNLDQTLRRLRRRSTVRVVGVAYAVQEEALLPSEEHDERLDLIITESEIIAASP